MTRGSRIFAVAMVLAYSLIALEATAEEREFNESAYRWQPELSKSGPVLVTVSLKTQTAAVYRNGIKIGSCEVSSGKPGHETPSGVFYILNKDADHHSKTYGNASMPYSERLTWDGVALHAGSLPGHPSSHGCIHLPYAFSKKLFGVTHKGTTVVVSKDSPDVHVSGNHSWSFRAGGKTDFIWKPEASAGGPVSLLFSKKAQKLYVIRNGVVIGECVAKTNLFSKRVKGTSAFVFAGWKVDGKKGEARSSWIQVSGNKGHHSDTLDEWFEVDTRFQHLLQGMITPGTNLVVTSEPVTDRSRSEMGFSLLQGQKEEKAIQGGGKG
ncbi:L,D-transpeptidase family protein [Verrucomicrobiaceae bacterium N1E253]|uniref:L,D-transpeptidase family protein n=1 Tax=Oceaniferula marina TaxID=2748318 RepID=A0A851GK57_9BACT|nr:L,D-transpeptidase family protein [Oceaniferula marina]NWK55555.1 L,D-transpeptidase family protein [Oceaniferula marina]